MQHLKRVENILFIEGGTIKLHGSYRYLSERGIDFDRILRAYEANDDDNEEKEEEKVLEKQEAENNLDINVYNLSDEYLDDDDGSEDEGEESEEDYKKDSLKLARQIQD